MSANPDHHPAAAGGLHPVPPGALEAVEAASRSVDQSFASMGGRLGEALDLFATLAPRLDALAEALADGVTGTREGLTPLPATLRALGRSLSESGSDLQAMRQAGQAAASLLQRLRADGQVVAAAAWNARIESARIAAASGGSFAEQLARLAASLAACIDRAVASERALGVLLARATAAVARFAAEQLPALARIGSQLHSQLLVAERWQKRCVEATGLVSRQSHRLLEALGEAMGALQGGDFVRQRLEHVASLLRMSAAPAALAEPAGALLAHLSGCQLGAAGERLRCDLLGAVGMLGLFRREVEQAASIDAASGSQDTGSSIAELSGTLGEASRLISACGQAQAELETLLGSIAASAEEFRREAEAVAETVRSVVVVGMNARLYAHRLGTDGQVLAVISGEIRSVVDQVAAAARAVVPMLDSMLEVSSRITGRGLGHADHAQGVGSQGVGIQEMGATISRAVEVLGGGSEQFQQTLGAWRAANTRAADLVSDACDSAARAGSVERELARLSALFAARPALALGTGQSEAIAELFARQVMPLYTMAEERTLHRQVLSCCGVAVADEPQAEAQDCFDDMLL